MTKLKIGLNGFGRIGRAFTRIASERDSLEIVAINTSKTTPDQLAYTLNYDSVYRRFNKKAVADADGISIDGTHIASYNIKNPAEIPWEKHEVDVVIDCTGVFKTREELKNHLRGSVKKVILSVPSSDESIPHVVLGVNDTDFDFAGADIISNASCTTNCAAVMVKVLEDTLGIEAAMLSTTHAYTSSQGLVDEASPKYTRSRAGALSIIPTTTGASKAICKVTSVPADCMTGISLRVPTPVGSITDLTCLVKKATTVEEINSIFKQASEGALKGILGYETEQLVSADYIGSPFSCTFDANYTQTVAGGRMIKIFGWYDNEWGYSARLVDMAERIATV